MPNPYYTHETGPICSIPDDLIEIIYKRDNFIKRIIEDSASEETLRLLRFLVWENSAVTAMVFNEIITLVSRTCLEDRLDPLRTRGVISENSQLI